MTSNILDLFCGAGGMGLGFAMAGFNVAVSTDINPHAVKTHSFNFPKCVSTLEDLTKISAEDFINKYNIHKDNIVGIIGGPPCQGFSIAGKRLLDDPRNKLFLEYVKFVEYIKPLFFVIENVPGLLSMNQGSVKNEILAIFQDMGYNVSYQILNAVDYNVPQLRKRLIFIGYKSGVPTFPTPMCDKNNYKTVGQSIMDLEVLEPSLTDEVLLLDGKEIHNHYAYPLTDINRARMSNIPEGGNHKNLPPNLQRNVHYASAYRRLHRSNPSCTITTHFRDEYLIHPTKDRIISVREAARLQTFPDNFVFFGPKSRLGQHGLVGNAVPPLLAKSIAMHIKSELELH